MISSIWGLGGLFWDNLLSRRLRGSSEVPRQNGIQVFIPKEEKSVKKTPVLIVAGQILFGTSCPV